MLPLVNFPVLFFHHSIKVILSFLFANEKVSLGYIVLYKIQRIQYINKIIKENLRKERKHLKNDKIRKCFSLRWLVPPISSESLSLQSQIIDKIQLPGIQNRKKIHQQGNFPPIATSSTTKSDPHKFQWYRNKRTLLAFYLLDALNHLCLRRLSPNCVQMFRIRSRNFITNALGTPRLVTLAS